MRPLSERYDYGSSDSDEVICEICGSVVPENTATYPVPHCRNHEKEYYMKHPPKLPPAGFGKPKKPIRKANLLNVAKRVAAVYNYDMLRERQGLDKPETEYSTRVELSFSADFEGTVSKEILTKKLEDEIISALESSIKIISRELRLRPGQVLVKPFRIEVAMNDQASFDEEND